jgi:uncharacterized membrane protein YgdD (TMEM256/DUF423 family)
MALKKNTLLKLGALSMAISVSLGAIAAHMLKKELSAKSLDIFHTGVNYQVIHSLSLIILSFIPTKVPLRWTPTLFLFGIIFFSFGCYLYAVTSIKIFAHIVPLGGLCFISGWVILFFNAKKLKE